MTLQEVLELNGLRDSMSTTDAIEQDIDAMSDYALSVDEADNSYWLRPDVQTEAKLWLKAVFAEVTAAIVDDGVEFDRLDFDSIIKIDAAQYHVECSVMKDKKLVALFRAWTPSHVRINRDYTIEVNKVKELQGFMVNTTVVRRTEYRKGLVCTSS